MLHHRVSKHVGLMDVLVLTHYRPCMKTCYKSSYMRSWFSRTRTTQRYVPVEPARISQQSNYYKPEGLVDRICTFASVKLFHPSSLTIILNIGLRIAAVVSQLAGRRGCVSFPLKPVRLDSVPRLRCTGPLHHDEVHP